MSTPTEPFYDFLRDALSKEQLVAAIVQEHLDRDASAYFETFADAALRDAAARAIEGHLTKLAERVLAAHPDAQKNSGELPLAVSDKLDQELETELASSVFGPFFTLDFLGEFCIDCQIHKPDRLREFAKRAALSVLSRVAHIEGVTFSAIVNNAFRVEFLHAPAAAEFARNKKAGVSGTGPKMSLRDFVAAVSAHMAKAHPGEKNREGVRAALLLAKHQNSLLRQNGLKILFGTTDAFDVTQWGLTVDALADKFHDYWNGKPIEEPEPELDETQEPEDDMPVKKAHVPFNFVAILRDECGFSPKELAVLIGCSRATVTNWAAKTDGHVEIDFAYLSDLADAITARRKALGSTLELIVEQQKKNADLIAKAETRRENIKARKAPKKEIEVEDDVELDLGEELGVDDFDLDDLDL